MTNNSFSIAVILWNFSIKGLQTNEVFRMRNSTSYADPVLNVRVYLLNNTFPHAKNTKIMFDQLW
jgi:hypothetical protein